jgi:hypothetical protein
MVSPFTDLQARPKRDAPIKKNTPVELLAATKIPQTVQSFGYVGEDCHCDEPGLDPADQAISLKYSNEMRLLHCARNLMFWQNSAAPNNRTDTIFLKIELGIQ